MATENLGTMIFPFCERDTDEECTMIREKGSKERIYYFYNVISDSKNEKIIGIRPGESIDHRIDFWLGPYTGSFSNSNKKLVLSMTNPYPSREEIYATKK
ncbi:MAG: hypothetical protein AAGC85_14665 [Bacteroidota bacterium]